MPKTIMTVDDSASLRQMVALTLKSAGFDVVEACDGQDALGRLAERRIDLVLTDLNMPRIDGIELTKRLRALDETRFTPIVLLTTESQPEKKLEGKAAGATGWIVKPFKPEQLLTVVQKVMR